MSRTVVVAEGVHDVWFWTGLAEHLGWTGVKQPRGKRLVHYFERDDDRLEVRECGGKDSGEDRDGAIVGVLEEAKCLVSERRQPPVLTRLLVNLDGDVAADAEGLKQKLRSFAARAELEAAPDRGWRTPDGDLTVDAVIWWGALDGDMQACLERLVCGVLGAQSQAAAGRVGAFIAGREALGPFAPSAAPKATLGAYRAGWFADASEGAFLARLWHDDATRAGLQRALDATGEWAVIQRHLGR